MAVLVEYSCRKCAGYTEHWVALPPPDEIACARCGEQAQRQFGGALLTGARESTVHAPAADGGGICEHAPNIPGVCTLTPTAARMLTARARRDNEALEREISHQESAIKAGMLDPNDSVVTKFAGGPPSSSTTPSAADL